MVKMKHLLVEIAQILPNTKEILVVQAILAFPIPTDFPRFFDVLFRNVDGNSQIPSIITADVRHLSQVHSNVHE